MTDHAVSEVISVILPAYNCEKTVEASIQSVLSQTYGNIELIIVDDASSDKTPEICRRFAGNDSRIRMITNSENRGRHFSRMNAVKNAKGEWIAFIDADDLWDSVKLEKQIELRDGSECDIVYTASAFIDEDGNKYEWIMHVPEEVGYRRLLKQNIISNSSVMVRKSDFLNFSPSEESGSNMHEDFACWLGMLRAGHTARGIDEPLIIYRVSKKSATGNKVSASKLNMNTYRYLKLGFFERLFYQSCYALNGLVKHSHFR